MGVETLPAYRRRMEQRSYRNFNLAIYCPVADVNAITDVEEFGQRFDRAFGGVRVGRVYLEDYRGYETCSKEQLLKVKAFFEQRGIATSGGITTCAPESKEFGFASLCYSDEEHQKILLNAVKLNAEMFDEFIFDDFYFLNCRCSKCVEKKGDKSWKQFRLEQKKWVTEELIMKPAKAIRPDVNVIVKFPQWFEDFNETGYDLDVDTSMFDTIYTGTETRNPTYSQQHLPKYLSYFTMRYYGSNAPGRNLGGWFDPYECAYNLTSYLEQGYLTLFAKAPEATLFCLGSLLNDPGFRTFPAALSAMFEEVDEYLDQLGNPIGVPAYHPSGGRGENNIHSYLGQAGVPMEPCLDYPQDAKVVFLAESSAKDPELIGKMKETLLSGGDVIVTSGLVQALGDAFREFGFVEYTTKKALVQDYCVSYNCGVNLSGSYRGTKQILIPQMDYCTNDVWEIAGAYGNDNNFPVVLSWSYAEGRISVITVPDDLGDLYHYPEEVWNVIRHLFERALPVELSGKAGVQLFCYDNGAVIVRSDLPYAEKVGLIFPKDSTLTDLTTNHILSGTMERRDDRMSRTMIGGDKVLVESMVMPGVNLVLRIG